MDHGLAMILDGGGGAFARSPIATLILGTADDPATAGPTALLLSGYCPAESHSGQ